MRVLLYGSAFMTSVVEMELAHLGHEVVGHVPNRACRFPGKMTSPVIPLKEPWLVPHDVAISVLYDQRIRHFERTYNVHPGLLPEYAGCNIPFWVLNNGEEECGWTCHQVVHEWDAGPIVSKITFPVFPYDSNLSIFARHALTLGGFVASVMDLFESGLLSRELPPQPPGRRYYPASLMNYISDGERVAFSEDGKAIADYVRSVQGD